MIKTIQTIATVKQAVQDCFQKPVTVRLDLGRNKCVVFPAVVNGVYSSLFTVEPMDKNFLGKTAYSYSEILCGRVKIKQRTAEAQSL